ncbi:MAG: hypothetical protein HOJ64_02930 [Euryarchaeota archaeon]|jgi:hypothetical protein|nr:hypothetical protein [Euryarchaeota archaeon]MBT4392142.1 hypothetical protein [Euryarchaeota archaeon]MBT4802411.1 hypothetical protein [Euryarchaeota archaeon]MBT5613806.1 hypothetical protein [Euryarchaeota archaeon]MBT6873802.1 hypothetical protein [Euryarchaeota archaeon]
MVDWKRISRRISSKKYRRNALVLSFWGLLLTLVLSIAFSYVVPGETQQSAYGNDWNDLGSFRDELNNLGIPTTALVSSPLLLSEVEYPEESIFIISGVERDTISLPRFTGDDDFIQFSEGDGYTSSEIISIENFVERGGTVLLMDDFGYSSNLASEFGLEYTGHSLYDGEAYDRDLGYNFVWVNTTSTYNFTSTPGSQNSVNPCIRDLDNDGFIDLLDNDPTNPNTPNQVINLNNVGLCAHRFDSDTGEWDFSENYNLLTNGLSAFEKTSAYNPSEHRYVIAKTTLDSWLDNNDDGNYTIGGYEALGIQGDEQGPFPVYVRYCDSILCRSADSGRVHFVSDGSMLINSLYNPEYDEKYSGLIPSNDNRKWALDIIAESLLIENSGTNVSSNALVIFDESRHQQPTVFGDMYNLIYYLLIYFTNDWMAMVILFMILFISLEAIIIRKEDPEDWRHIFRIIYYGFGDANRYEYYQKSDKIRQVLLTRVRNLNTLSREEFDALPAVELQKMVKDPVLIRFIFEDRKYRPDELVGVVKRIKDWGNVDT